MRLICYLLLTSCWCSLWAKGVFSAYTDDEGKLVTDHSMDRSSSERLFIGSLKKWLLRSGGEKKETEIKYLPVYIPVPVYSDINSPDGSDFHVAYQNMPAESPMIQVPNMATLPYGHSQNYDLPYAGELHRKSLPFNGRQAEAGIFHQRYYQQMFRNPYAYGGYNFPYSGSYAPPPVYYDREDDGQESEELDSVVVENTSLNKDMFEENNTEDFVRNRKKTVKKNRKGSGKL